MVMMSNSIPSASYLLLKASLDARLCCSKTLIIQVKHYKKFQFSEKPERYFLHTFFVILKFLRVVLRYLN